MQELLVVIVLVFIIIRFFFAKKGARGEFEVFLRMRWLLPKNYLILNNIYLPLPDGTTTQIDHIVVSEFGIFVIETKTYAGWIFANEKNARWTQKIYRMKNTFQNPLRQNYSHICALSNNLGIDKRYFHSVVVFNGECEFKTAMPRGVVYFRNVADYILTFSQRLIKSSQVEDVKNVILEWQSTVSSEKKRMHVKNLKKKHAEVTMDREPLCPYCGEKMVLRKRRSDGQPFFGCSSFPKCKGTVNVK